MESVLRAAAVYLFLLVVFRVGGRRTLAEMTPFDLALVLIVAEAASQALIGEDFSVINAFVVVATLFVLERLFARVKQHSKAADRWLDGVPTVLVDDGEVLQERLQRSHVDRADILEAARAAHGLANFAQIRYAVLERDGSISVIPREDPR
ncbi:DUF421 domain-containing protein [Arenimonas composti]|uniref:YetF C-terminal domain-containing protein n=1 Tax=Arenimonas composti TR7-09 = DSM 18010 TaxID=1121013 RepID=A0A091BHB8_9GAMM|nr:YetF domain-containing protein [Arenimonas composti]KFN50184.1 hypothetical protein P873_08065 [Arenimonas composti TR7-09 = DSM 18010]